MCSSPELYIFKDNTYYLDETYDCHNRDYAFGKATEIDKLPLGIFYKSPDKSTFEDNVGIYEEDDSPLFRQNLDYQKLETLIKKFILT